MTNRPLVAVTTSEVREPGDVHQTAESEPPRREMALGLSYLNAVERGGGLPVVLTPLHADSIEPMLDRLSGLCISGGPDLDPATYGEKPHPKLGPIEPEIDVFELTLLKAADRRNMPILAICRGIQVLNVSRGGTLHQHLPDLGRRVHHRQRKPGGQTTHRVEIAAGSLAAATLDGTEVAVNSFHHQAVKDLGRGLRATAWAPDGVVEAIEAPRRDWVLGVQWHAEALSEHEPHSRLFSEFIRAAQRYGAGGSRAKARPRAA